MNFLKGILGKYKWSFYLLLTYVLIDVFVHKGMLRVVLPSPFRDQGAPSVLPKCASTWPHQKGKWKKAVNTPEAIPDAVQDFQGLEMDVYFDTAKAGFFVFHDSSEKKRPPIDSIFLQLRKKNFTGVYWLDFKNLDQLNEKAALRRLLELTRTYHLYSRIIVEAGHPEYLRSFCEGGFFTSYYVPLFNPYLLKEKEQTAYADAIAEKCRKFPVSALSGYYFQYPFLKERFPGMPLLTWVENPRWSLVNFLFQEKLRHDPSLVAVMAY